MLRILFSHSYFMRYDPKQWATAQPYPPLATIGAAALLRENGFQVSLFDAMFVRLPEELFPRLEAERPDIFVIYDDGFNYLTKMCLTNMRDAAFRMIRLARRRGCRVIVSSSDSTDRFRQYLDEGADFVLLGEGEQTLLELVRAIGTGNVEPEQIAGLAWLSDGTPKRSESRKAMKDLDHLPIPAWDLVDMESYRRIWVRHHGYFSINVSTTRGCPFKCNWCAKPIYGNRYNARSPQHVAAEIRLLKKEYGIDHIWMCDDIFGLKPGWVDEFATVVAREGLSIRFKIQSRADLLVQENYVAALARAGCVDTWMGAESGSQKILDAMDKGTTVQQIAEATRLLRLHGIRASFFIQFGYPGETKEDIGLTIHMIKKLMPDSIGISVSYPLPGTVFHERVKGELKEKTNWTDSDELKLMFRNRYSPAFYKQLHRYVHKTYRRQLALCEIGKLFRHPGQLTKKGVRMAAALSWYLADAAIAGWRLRQLERLPLV